MTTSLALRCRVCEQVTAPAPVRICRRCDGPTDLTYDWDAVRTAVAPSWIASGPASLWRYRDLLPSASIELGAGWTPLVRADRLSELLGVDLRLKLETANPTHSFKDRVAAVAVAAALDHGMTTLCCSSNGNLGDAVAAACAAAGLEAFVLTPVRHTWAPVSGASVFVVDGTYDDCCRLEADLAELFPWGFVGGNLHPYAIEGAKTVAFEIAEQLGWTPPDVVVCAAASGALFAKVAQGFAELERLDLCDRSPRLFAAQAEGASPIAAAYAQDEALTRTRPETDVHSLAVGDPEYGELAIGAARGSGGSIVAVAEAEMRSLTELLAQTTGVFADEAGGAALAALLRALREGRIERGSQVVLVVTGSGLRQPGGAPEVEVVDANVEDVVGALQRMKNQHFTF
jgi:threonine synthase